MEVEFELTFDDFVQSLAMYHSRERQRGAQVRTSWGGLAILIVMVLIAIGLVLYSARKDIDFDPTAAAAAAALPAPWFVLAIINLASLVTQRGGRKPVIVFLLMTAVLGSGVAAATLWAAAGTAPWLWMAWALVGIYWASLWRVYVQRTGFRWFWEHDRRLRGRKSLGWNDNELSFADSDSKLSYRWHSLQGWLETTDVLLIFVSPIEFHMVPKRAFGSPELLASFRDALASSTQARGAAFPVLPAKGASKDAGGEIPQEAQRV
jgi:hypothetical protein